MVWETTSEEGAAAISAVRSNSLCRSVPRKGQAAIASSKTPTDSHSTGTERPLPLPLTGAGDGLEMLMGMGGWDDDTCLQPGLISRA